MVVWSVVILAILGSLGQAADPPATGITTIGSLKLATAADCAGAVAFSATTGTGKENRIFLSDTLVDKGVGYDSQNSVFTTHCPGLYQFSFAGYGSPNLTLSLKNKDKKSDTWKTVAKIGPGGGMNLVLLDVDAGDQVAVFLDKGDVKDGATFSGHRISKK